MADQPDEPLFGTIHSPGVTVFSSDRAAARALARRIAAAVQAKPRLVLGLPTGRTPVALYHELASLHAHGHADFSQVTTFNLDEFLGIPPSHPGSYRSFMERHLFSRVNIPPEHTNVLDGSAPDPEAECARYEKKIADVGWIDLQVLGIGTNGHIGFNEPARVLQSRTHRVVLRPETRRSNAVPLRRRSGPGAARSPLDGDGHDPEGPLDRPARNGAHEGGVRRACRERAADH